MDRILKKAARFAARYEKWLGILAFGWLMFTGAVYARFISLPDIPYLTDRNAWMISGPWNMFWWGYLQPKLVKHQDALQQEEPVDGG